MEEHMTFSYRPGRALARLVLPVAGVLALTGLASGALAANVDTETSFAGQGNGTVTGFVTSNFAYTTSLDSSSTESALVTKVIFDIARQASPQAVGAANAKVWIQLRSNKVGVNNSNWVACTLTPGLADCNTSALNFSMTNLDDLAIVAYDI
jgi:hypothetical protein